MERKMLFRRSLKNADVTIGAIYERILQENIKERAQVTWIGNDSTGIPHVRFDVVIPGIDESRDARLLAMATFQERYAQATATSGAA
jgi:hypothetical protein